MSSLTISSRSLALLDEIIDSESQNFTQQEFVEKMIADYHSEVDYLKKTEPGA